MTQTGQTFLWHDYETFGANPMADRPAQFAAQRTDMQLNPLGEPLKWYCSPADDVLPHPMACLITGITPQEARRKGLVETEFAQKILDEMMRPGTCSAGYNSIRFDDAVTRNLLYRNLRDPYEREWKNGNSRWDLIDLARMCYALRPAGVNWPMHEPGKPSFRLEDLSRENNIGHEGAHDALADVRATIDLARLLRTAQPRLFEWALGMRDKTRVAKLLDPTNPSPVLHTSSRIAAARGCTAMVMPLALDPKNPKCVYVIDLATDPGPLIRETADVIRDLVFTPADDLPEEFERLALKKIYINHVPMLAPPATLQAADTDRIGMNIGKCMENARELMSSLDTIRHKVIEVFAMPPDLFEESNDPDRMIYSGGFFSSADRNLMDKILAVQPQKLSSHLWTFQDERLQLMLFRYRARNYPQTLNLEEARIWEKDRRMRLVETSDPAYFTMSEFRAAMSEAREQREDEPAAQELLDQLDSWVHELALDTL
jgi:exodeoxyribonuclease-1